MNHGHPNQAMRCFRVLIDGFFAKVKAANPGLETTSITVQPRNLFELPPTDCDLYLSSGGPGSPFEHDGETWLTSYYGWLDSIVERNLREGSAAPGLLGVCYTFELLINHFKVARMVQRANRKFGVMPIYTTAEGLAHPLTAPFQDRLFAFENRSWEAVDLDERQLRSLGGKLLARESRDGYSKGLGLHAFEFAPGIEGTQFHPEADKPGVIAWLRKREQAEAFIEAYGAITYQRMLRTLDNPERLAKTFTSLIPGWLTRRFNALAQHRGWAPLPRPELSFELFAGDAPSAASIAYHSLLPSDLPRPPQLDFDDATAPVNFTGAEHFDSAPPISEVLVPLARPTELDPAALGESVLQPPGRHLPALRPSRGGRPACLLRPRTASRLLAASPCSSASKPHRTCAAKRVTHRKPLTIRPFHEKNRSQGIPSKQNGSNPGGGGYNPGWQGEQLGLWQQASTAVAKRKPMELSRPRSRIYGTGRYVPSRVLTNKDLEQLVDTSDAWITERTGIRERHVAADGETTSDMAAAAGRAALEMAGIPASKLSMIIVGTISPDTPMPACAVHVQQKLGAGHCPSFDLSAACAGFLYGMSIADQFIRTGQGGYILVIGVELLSRILNWKDRTTCVLFGDGAGAVVLGPSDEGPEVERPRGVLATRIYTDGSLAEALVIPAGGSREPVTPEGLATSRNKVHMSGQEIFKVAVKNLTSATRESLDLAGIAPEQVDWVVAHQANLRILNQVASRLAIPQERFVLNIERYGNTSSASIPIALDEAVRDGRVKSGHNLAMCALGAGISWGGAVVRF
jgi:3-oxoacyl-[acyl-carrier-protein] synthase-3